MSERHEPVTIEERLDRYIDLSRAGNQQSIHAGDELQDLARTVETVRSHAAVEQAERDGFPQGMAEVLGRSLRGPEAQHSARNLLVPTAPANGSPPTNTAMDAHPSDWERLDDRKQTSHSRQFLQLAAGIAGLAVVATVLALVFRPGGDSGVVAPGIGDSDDLILFSAGERSSEDIYVIDPDTNEQVNLSDNPASDTMPSWSPDGERIAFYSNRDNNDGSHDLYLMDADGSNVEQIAEGRVNASILPAWSPDGQRIAFVGIGEDPIAGSDLRVINADGSDQRTLHSVEASDGYGAAFVGPLSWSADGTRLAVDEAPPAESGGTSIVHFEDGFVMMLEGATEAIWSPVENEIAYIQDGGQEETGIYTSTLNGTEPEQILSLAEETSALSISWSPDGRKLLTSVSETVPPATIDLVSIDAESGDQQPLGAPDDEFTAATFGNWSPDGERIAYIAAAFSSENEDEAPAQQLRVMNSDGSDVAELSTDPPISPPQWRPSGDTSTPQPENQFEELTPTPDLTEQLTPPAGEEEPATPTDPSINVVPYELTCDGSAAVIGSGFEPGATVDIYPGDQAPETPDGSAIASADVAADGSFEVDGLTTVGELITNCEEMAANGGGDVVLSVASITDDDDGTGYSDIFTDAVAILTPADASSEPALTLDPTMGTCDTAVTAIGTNFEPGTQVTFSVFPMRGDNGTIMQAHPTVRDDGTFSTELDMSIALQGCAQQGVPEAGQRYSVSVQTGAGVTDDKNTPDTWREPSATTVYTHVPTEDTNPNEVMAQQAIAAVRDFLDEPDAELVVREIAEDSDSRQVRVGRQVEDAWDEFTYDADYQHLINATVQSHSSVHASINSISADEALSIAESVASENYQGFDQLTLYETSDQDTVPGADGEDRVYSATWQLRANDTVWVPTQLRVQVNLETGLLQSYSFNHEPYRGPLDPAIPEQQALDITQDRIDTDPTLEGAAIGEVELTTSYVVLEMDDNGNVTNGEWVLTWRVHLDNEPEEAPAPYLDINALTGEILTDID